MNGSTSKAVQHCCFFSGIAVDDLLPIPERPHYVNYISTLSQTKKSFQHSSRHGSTTTISAAVCLVSAILRPCSDAAPSTRLQSPPRSRLRPACQLQYCDPKPMPLISLFPTAPFTSPALANTVHRHDAASSAAIPKACQRRPLPPQPSPQNRP